MRYLRLDAFAVVRPTEVYLLKFFCSGSQFYVLLSPYLCFISFLYIDLYVLGDNSWISTVNVLKVRTLKINYFFPLFVILEITFQKKC